ncbi:MAG TPA: tetratricopeptide repeat protein [Pseudolabrys sp.]|nr:tetratricopeptide repeat protein [Pseudolabrys sp.]
MAAPAIERILSDAFRHYRSGDLANAELRCRSLLDIDPDNLIALRLVGFLSHQAGRNAEGVALLQRAVTLLEQRGNSRPEHAAIYNDFANALRSVGRGDDALVQFRRGLELDPELADLHANMADELCCRGDFDVAIAGFEAARRCGVLSGPDLCRLGTAYALKRRFAEAEAAYRDAIVPYLGSATPRANAIASHAADLISAPPPIDNRSAVVLERYRELLTNVPPEPNFFFLFANALRACGDARAAIAVFEYVLTLKPDHVAANYELGVTLAKVGFPGMAVPYLEKAIEHMPNFANFHIELGNLLHSLGCAARAYDCHRQAVRLQPVRSRKFDGGSADFSVLSFEASGIGNTPSQFLFSDAPFDCHFAALLPDVVPDHDMLRRYGDVVVNLVSEADQGEQLLPLAAALIDRLGKPIINHPRKVLATDRVRTAEKLTGIPSCRVAKTMRCRHESVAAPGGMTALAQSGFVFPLLLRVAGSHGGDAFEKLYDEGDLTTFLQENSGRDLYVSEYLDYRSIDGYYRKYRFIFVNEEIYPYHLAICDDWKVHHFRTDMAARPWMQHEEKAFLDNPWKVFSTAHRAALEKIRMAFELDFFGVDCGLDQEGNLVVFEVNASMLVHNQNDALAYKTPHCIRIRDAFHAMLLRIAAAGTKAAA